MSRGGHMTELARGAEAIVAAAQWDGRQVVTKHRVGKAYRHPELDSQLRNDRTRDEANLLLKCRQAGVPVPVLYDADRDGATLTLEHIDGISLKQHLQHEGDGEARLQHLGELVARMHDAGITHGDLTTSNVLVDGERLVLIDFGLGQATQEPEPRGVDLHLVEEALEATRDDAEGLMAAFLQGYGAADCAAASIARLEAIRQRGRYREAI